VDTLQHDKDLVTSTSANSDFVEMPEQIRPVLVNPVRAGTLKFLSSVASGQQSYAERAGATGSQKVPYAVANDDGVDHVYAEPSKYPPAEPGALRVGPLEAAGWGR
jgi:hypothetical protein